MRVRAVLMLLLLVASAARAGDPARMQAAMEGLEAQRTAAMIAEDTETLRGLLADGMTYTHSTGLVQDKLALLSWLDGGSVDYRAIENGDDVHFQMYPNTAVITGSQTIDLVVDGREITSNSRFTVVWIRTGKDWKCVAYQSTPIQ